MDLDPHMLQQILQRIEQQMRCPQCGKKVPIDINSIRVVADSALLLQLKCDQCNAYIVLQASMQGLEQLSAPPYEEDVTSNASSTLEVSKEDLSKIRRALQASGGSFSSLFEEENAGQSTMSDAEIV